MLARQAIALAAITALVTVQAPALASPPTYRTPTLHATQTLSSQAASTRAVVALGKDVTISGGATCVLSARARFKGTARQAAVFLTSLPLTPQSRVVWIARISVGGQTRTYDSECLSTTLPKGRYLLQYTHSPGSSEVTLTLPGQTGIGKLMLKEPDGAIAAELPPVLTSPADSATASWGTHNRLTGRGSVLTVGVVASGLSDKGLDTQGDCLVTADGRDLPDALAYAPGCPAGGSGSSYGFTGSETWQSTLTGNLPEGSYGAGYWFVGTPTHRPFGATAFWLPNLS